MKMKWIKFRILFLVSFALSAATCAGRTISTYQDWEDVATNRAEWSQAHSLGGNLTLVASSTTIEHFTGVLDGRGFAFNGIEYVSRSPIENATGARFINLKGTGIIGTAENCEFENCTFLSAGGNFIGQANNSKFSRCTTKAAGNFSDVGRFVGQSQNCAFDQCTVGGSVSFVGMSQNGVFSGCSGSPESGLGGSFISSSDGDAVSNCESSVSFFIRHANGTVVTEHIGPVVEEAEECKIFNCMAENSSLVEKSVRSEYQNCSVKFSADEIQGMFHSLSSDLVEKCRVENGYFTWIAQDARFRFCENRSNVIFPEKSTVGGLYVGWDPAAGCVFEKCKLTCDVTSDRYEFGGFVPSGTNCTFKWCSVEGSITGAGRVGGIAGTLNDFSLIKQCDVNIDITGGHGGGLASVMNVSTADLCVVSGRISCDQGQNVGGLVGDLNKNSGLLCCTSHVAVSGYEHVGGLVGFMRESDISTCGADGSVMGQHEVGGLAGSVYFSEIECSAAKGNVQAEVFQESGASNRRFGGLVGLLHESTLFWTRAEGAVTGTAKAAILGGLVGEAEQVSRIENSCALGNVTGGQYVGGFLAYADDPASSILVRNCYARGAATSLDGEDSTAAFVAMAGRPALLSSPSDVVQLKNCYATGTVTASKLIMGYDMSNSGGLSPVMSISGMISGITGETESCYYDKLTVKLSRSGLNNPDGDSARDTLAMKDKSTYVGWDFNKIWKIENGDYPTLRFGEGCSCCCEAEPVPPDEPEDPDEPCKLKVTQTSLHFGCEGGRIDLGVESKVRWSGTKLSGDSGCAFSASSGDGDATLTVSVTSNRTDAARSWSWQISSDCGVATIEITQEACRIPDPECSGTIDVGTSLVVFEDCKADSKHVSVTSSDGWSSRVNGGAGLIVTSIGSEGESVAVFEVTENTTGKLREWDVVFTGQNECGDEYTATVHVTQGTCLPECEISVGPGLVTFGCGRGGRIVQVKSSRAWSAQKLSGDADCTLSSASGSGDATLTISVSSNRTESVRSWSWQIASDCGVATLEVRQESCNSDCACSIVTDTLLVEFENCEADFRRIGVTSSVDWSSRVNGGTGLSVTSSGLKGRSAAVFAVSENMTGNPREWDVVFTGRTECGDECSTTVHVTQGTCQLECRIRVTPSERVVNANRHSGFLTVTANDSWTLDAKSVPRWIVPLLRSGLAGTWCVPYIVRAQPDCGSGDAADSRRASLRFVNAQGCSDTFVLEQLGRECCTFLSIYREGEEQYAFTTNGVAFSLSLKVRSSSAWAAVSEADWVRVATANQETDELTLEVSANSGEERRGEVRVTNADGDARIFTILQTPETLAVAPEHVLLPPEAGEATVAIRSSADWTVRIPDEARSWLSVSPDSRSGDGTITIAVEPNAGEDLRFAEVTVAAGLIEKELLVVQDTAATRLGITGPDSMRSDGTAENLCVVVSPGCEAEPVSPTWSVTGPDGIRIGTDGTVSLDGILLTQAVATVTAQYVVDGKELVANREIEILPKPGPGVWTTDVTAALAGARGDGRLILALASNYEMCHFCRLFEPVAWNPEFLKWAHDNGVYLVAATRSGPCGESVTDEYFWTLARSFGHTGSVSLPSLVFAYPSDLYQGVGLDTGRVGNTIGTVEYDGTVVTLIEGVASYLKSWTVSYKPGEYGVGPEQTATKLKGIALTLEDAIFTRSGYTQTGWSLTDGGAKAYDLNGAYATDAEIVLYPYWVANSAEPVQTIGEALGVPGIEWSSCDTKYTLKIDHDWTCDGNGSVRTADMSFQAERRCGISVKVKGPTSMKFSYSKSFSAATFMVDCGPDFLYKDDMPGIKTEWKQVILDIPAGEQTVYIYARPGYFFFNEENEYNGFWIDNLQFGDFEHERVYLINYDQGPGSELTTSAAQARPYSNPLTYTASDLPLVLADAKPLKAGYGFVGWSMDGKMVTEIPKGTTGNIQLVAVWDQEEYPNTPQLSWTNGVSRLYETLDLKYIWPKPYVGTAAVYDGYLSDADGIVRGTIQVKVAKGKTDRKTGKFSAKVTATVQLANEPKKIKFKGGVVDSDIRGLVSAMSAGGHVLNAQVGEYGLGGTMDGLTIDGARNVFTGKYEGDSTFADAASGCMGVYNLAGECGALSVSVAKKGKVKISGTVNGVKVSATSQLLVGNEVCCIPIVIAQKTSLALNLLISKDGKEAMVQGTASVASGHEFAFPFWVAGKPGAIANGAKFELNDEAIGKLKGWLAGLYAAYLPNGLAVAQDGKKWIVAGGAKAGKLVLDKTTGALDLVKSKITDNTSGLKLTYKEKDGTFKGSFKVYNLENGTKIKSYTANVTGVLIGEKGYGTMTIKKVGTVTVSLAEL